MSKGLDAILERIKQDPSPTLISRYLALVAELSDEAEKARRALAAATAVRTIAPEEALKIAKMVYGTGQDPLGALDVMIAVLSSRGRHGKAEVLKIERDRLLKDGAGGAVAASAPAAATTILLDQDPAARFLAELPQADDDALDESLAQLRWQAPGEPGASDIGRFHLRAASVAPTDAAAAAGIAPQASLAPGQERIVVPQRTGFLEEPEESRIAELFAEARQESSLKFADLLRQDGTQVSSLTSNLALDPPSRSPSLPPAAGIDAKRVWSAIGGEHTAISSLQRPMAGLPDLMESLPRASVGSQSVTTAALAGLPILELEPPEPPATPIRLAPEAVWPVATSVATAELPASQVGVGNSLAAAAQSAASESGERRNGRQPTRERAQEATRVANRPEAFAPPADAVHQRGELDGQLAAQEAGQHGRAADPWTQLHDELVALAADPPHRQRALPRRALAERQVPSAAIAALQAADCSRLSASGRALLWELLSPLWVHQADAACYRLIKSLSLYRLEPRWLGLYLDAMLATGRHALVVPLLQSVLREGEQASYATWAEAGMQRLPRVWQALGVEGFQWTVDDGIAALRAKLLQRPAPRLRSLVAASRSPASAQSG